MTQEMQHCPDMVQVGYLPVQIQAWPAKVAVCNGRFGEFSMYEQAIRYDESLTHEKRANTLLHETLHAIWEVYNLGGDGDEEERLVKTLANALCDVMGRNPGFVLHLLDSLAGVPGDDEGEESL